MLIITINPLFVAKKTWIHTIKTWWVCKEAILERTVSAVFQTGHIEQNPAVICIVLIVKHCWINIPSRPLSKCNPLSLTHYPIRLNYLRIVCTAETLSRLTTYRFVLSVEKFASVELLFRVPSGVFYTSSHYVCMAQLAYLISEWRIL